MIYISYYPYVAKLPCKWLNSMVFDRYNYRQPDAGWRLYNVNPGLISAIVYPPDNPHHSPSLTNDITSEASCFEIAPLSAATPAAFHVIRSDGSDAPTGSSHPTGGRLVI